MSFCASHKTQRNEQDNTDKRKIHNSTGGAFFLANWSQSCGATVNSCYVYDNVPPVEVNDSALVAAKTFVIFSMHLPAESAIYIQEFIDLMTMMLHYGLANARCQTKANVCE